MKERMHFTKAGDSYTRVSFRAEGGPWDMACEPIGALPSVASDFLAPAAPVGWPDKMPNGRGRLVSTGHKPMNSHEAANGLDGLWIQTRRCDTSDEGGEAQGGPWRRYCLLCEAEADEEHLASRKHLQARRAVVGGPSFEGGVDKPLHSELDILPFSGLHPIDLSNPELNWPQKLRLLRIEPFVFAEAALQREQEFGLLVAPDLETEKSHPHFGVSLEWCRGTQQRGCARFIPEMVDWWQLRQAPSSPQRPEEQLRFFHEAQK